MFPPQLGSWSQRIVGEKAREYSVIHSEDEAIRLAGIFDITVWHINTKFIKGILLQLEDDSKPTIFINKNLPEVLRVKSILHELGHYILHCDNCFRPLFADYYTMLGREEREADYFAWCLMSEGLKEEYLEHNLISEL